MFDQYDFILRQAQRYHERLEKQRHKTHGVEGMTTQVPNMIDRMLMTARAVLTRQRAKTQQQSKAPHHSEAIAHTWQTNPAKS